jgi:predicted Zn-dependent protease
MQKLGRPPKAMGELMMRVTGKEGGKGLTIISTHPLTEDRLARMSKEDQTVKGPPLLTDVEWQALKGICGKGKV